MTLMQKAQLVCSVKAKVLCRRKTHPNQCTDCDQYPPYATVLSQNKILQGFCGINLEDCELISFYFQAILSVNLRPYLDG